MSAEIRWATDNAGNIIGLEGPDGKILSYYVVSGATGVAAIDRASIQNTINAACAAGGGTVIVPAGTYIVKLDGGSPNKALSIQCSNITLQLMQGAIIKLANSEIMSDARANLLLIGDDVGGTAYSNIRILGPGYFDWNKKTVVNPNGNHAIFNNYLIQSAAIRINQRVSDVEITAGVRNTETDVIYMAGSSTYPIRRVSIHDAYFFHFAEGIVGIYAEDVKINHNILDADWSAFRADTDPPALAQDLVEASTGSTRWTVGDNILMNCEQAAVDIFAGASFIDVHDNIVMDANRNGVNAFLDIGSTGTDQGVHNVNVHDNVLIGGSMGGPVSQMSWGRAITLRTNTPQNNRKINIVHNHIYGFQDSGIFFANGLAEVDVLDNYISYIGAVGINIQGSNQGRINVRNNTVQYTGQSGIRSVASNSVFNNNTTRYNNSGAAGLARTGTDISFTSPSTIGSTSTNLSIFNVAGKKIFVTGTTNNANNNWYTVVSANATSITVAETTITTQAAAPSIIVAGRQAMLLANDVSFTAPGTISSTVSDLSVFPVGAILQINDTTSNNASFTVASATATSLNVTSGITTEAAGKLISISDKNTSEHGMYMTGDNVMIQNNACYDGRTVPTQDGGIFDAGTTNSRLTANKCYGNVTYTIRDIRGAGTKIDHNDGFITENSGTATVANGTTSIAVSHGLSLTPALADISVTPTNSMGSATKYYISNPTSTQITINTNVDPGATTATFAWTAIKR